MQHKTWNVRSWWPNNWYDWYCRKKESCWLCIFFILHLVHLVSLSRFLLWIQARKSPAQALVCFFQKHSSFPLPATRCSAIRWAAFHKKSIRLSKSITHEPVQPTSGHIVVTVPERSGIPGNRLMVHRRTPYAIEMCSVARFNCKIESKIGNDDGDVTTVDGVAHIARISLLITVEVGATNPRVTHFFPISTSW